MNIVPTNDTQALRRLWQRHPLLHIYELGDLDPEWSRFCLFLGGHAGGILRHAALLYQRPDPPVLLLLGPADDDTLPLFARALAFHLPDRLYAHLSPGLVAALPGFAAGNAKRAIKMGLSNRRALPPAPASQPLTPAHGDEVLALLDAAYPGHFFEPAALECGVYRGIRESGRLVAAAGVHVLSEREGVAALGNIVVRTDCRGRGLGRSVTLAVCQALPPEVRHIGLNVYAGNEPAIRVYSSLGFCRIADYEEVTLERVLLAR